MSTSRPPFNNSTQYNAEKDTFALTDEQKAKLLLIDFMNYKARSYRKNFWSILSLFFQQSPENFKKDLLNLDLFIVDKKDLIQVYVLDPAYPWHQKGWSNEHAILLYANKHLLTELRLRSQIYNFRNFLHAGDSEAERIWESSESIPLAEWYAGQESVEVNPITLKDLTIDFNQALKYDFASISEDLWNNNLLLQIHYRGQAKHRVLPNHLKNRIEEWMIVPAFSDQELLENSFKILDSKLPSIITGQWNKNQRIYELLPSLSFDNQKNLIMKMVNLAVLKELHGFINEHLLCIKMKISRKAMQSVFEDLRARHAHSTSEYRQQQIRLLSEVLSEKVQAVKELTSIRKTKSPHVLSASMPAVGEKKRKRRTIDWGQVEKMAATPEIACDETSCNNNVGEKRQMLKIETWTQPTVSSPFHINDSPLNRECSQQKTVQQNEIVYDASYPLDFAEELSKSLAQSSLASSQIEQHSTITYEKPSTIRNMWWQEEFAIQENDEHDRSRVFAQSCPQLPTSNSPHFNDTISSTENLFDTENQLWQAEAVQQDQALPTLDSDSHFDDEQAISLLQSWPQSTSSSNISYFNSSMTLVGNSFGAVNKLWQENAAPKCIENNDYNNSELKLW